jgi:hypothetical protein
LKIQLFSGTDPFGAAQFDLGFLDTELEIVEIRRLAHGNWKDKVYVAQSANLLSIVIFNDASLTKPAGTVALLEIVVLPKVNAGASTEVSILPREVLTTLGSTYSSKEGYSAEITVLAPPPATLASRTLAASGGVESKEPAPITRVAASAAAKDIPAGTPYRVWEPSIDSSGRKTWAPREVQTFDPSAPSD